MDWNVVYAIPIYFYLYVCKCGESVRFSVRSKNVRNNDGIISSIFVCCQLMDHSPTSVLLLSYLWTLRLNLTAAPSLTICASIINNLLSAAVSKCGWEDESILIWMQYAMMPSGNEFVFCLEILIRAFEIHFFFFNLFALTSATVALLRMYGQLINLRTVGWCLRKWCLLLIFFHKKNWFCNLQHRASVWTNRRVFRDYRSRANNSHYLLNYELRANVD